MHRLGFLQRATVRWTHFRIQQKYTSVPVEGTDGGFKPVEEKHIQSMRWIVWLPVVGIGLQAQALIQIRWTNIFLDSMLAFTIQPLRFMLYLPHDQNSRTWIFWGRTGDDTFTSLRFQSQKRVCNECSTKTPLHRLCGAKCIILNPFVVDCRLPSSYCSFLKGDLNVIFTQEVHLDQTLPMGILYNWIFLKDQRKNALFGRLGLPMDSNVNSPMPPKKIRDINKSSIGICTPSNGTLRDFIAPRQMTRRNCCNGPQPGGGRQNGSFWMMCCFVWGCYERKNNQHKVWCVNYYTITFNNVIYLIYPFNSKKPTKVVNGPSEDGDVIETNHPGAKDCGQALGVGSTTNRMRIPRHHHDDMKHSYRGIPTTYPYNPCMVYLPTFTIFCHYKQPNVGIYTIHGSYGLSLICHEPLSWVAGG